MQLIRDKKKEKETRPTLATYRLVRKSTLLQGEHRLSFFTSTFCAGHDVSDEARRAPLKVSVVFGHLDLFSADHLRRATSFLQSVSPLTATVRQARTGPPSSSSELRPRRPFCRFPGVCAHAKRTGDLHFSSPRILISWASWPTHPRAESSLASFL